MSERLNVCFIWHMHQPLYKDRMSGTYLQPWVRLHAIKDYLDMPLILRDFPRIRQTFNLVPSLLEQIEDYAWNGATDRQLILMCQPEQSYTLDDKLYVLRESFHANLEHKIRPFPPYFELFLKRQRLLKKAHSLPAIVDDFSLAEYADMLVWMNLAWFDPLFQEDEEIAAWIKQGRNFVHAQRVRLIEKERELMRRILPTYKERQESGQIEITTSPYYHPILPLLVDSNSARLADNNVRLPQKLFFNREDARQQLSLGLSFYRKRFGTTAPGCWPSELSVSPAALELIASTGFKWAILDEGVLAKSIGSQIERDEHGDLVCPQSLCQPYRFQVGEESTIVFFREALISNEISFAYSGRPATEAASKMYMRLKHIQQRLLNWEREGCVVIALDGENCWETYDRDGHDFLHELYTRLSQDKTLNVCTVSDYLERHPPNAELYNIQPGSWIDADFHVWIGDPVKNRAWDLLSDTRRFLVDKLNSDVVSAEIRERAWEEIYAAEGSDWFWWFGEPNTSEHDATFDEQFRLRLQNVYKLFGEQYPKALDLPVAQQVFRALQPVLAAE